MPEIICNILVMLSSKNDWGIIIPSKALYKKPSAYPTITPKGMLIAYFTLSIIS